MPEEAKNTSKLNKEMELQTRVLEEKVKFLQQAKNIRPFGFVEEHPKISVGCAFASGFLLDRLSKSKVSFMPLGLQLLQILLKFIKTPA